MRVNKRVVLDTNVLVAGLSSRDGASFQLLKMVRLRSLTVLMSVPLWFEYESVLKRSRVAAMHGLTEDEVDQVLNMLAALCESVCLDFLWRPQLRDALDEMVLETALNGRAQALVTFNVKDFRDAAAHFKLPVITPAQCLRHMRNSA